ncbi:hypothetical protein AB3M89_13555 [Microbacterium sp. 179-I 3D2 NHS]|uniref:hypothetical protein n=1 Tax=Microbacterium sp. 179-I 3D2 NHS TaxID=3235178 RepID=UPI00399FC6C7
MADWRRYAGALRQKVGAGRREVVELEGELARVSALRDRDRKLLTAVERDLQAGDIPAAVDKLAWRRSRINAAGAGS